MPLRIPAACLCLLAALAGCGRRGAARIEPAPTVLGANVARGKIVYRMQCAACHGEGGTAGQIGPSLQNENRRHGYRWVYATVADPAPPMPKLYPSRMTQADVRDVSAYVETL